MWQQGPQAPRAGPPRTSLGRQGSAGWVRRRPGGKGCGMGRADHAAAGAPFSLPPRSRRPGCGDAHLPAGGRGPGWGCGTGKFVSSCAGLCRVHGSVLQLQPRLRRGLRGCKERLGPQDARKRAPGPAPHKTPFLPPAPAPPFPGAAPAPWPGTRGAREGHETRSLLCVGSLWQLREQGRAK